MRIEEIVSENSYEIKTIDLGEPMIGCYISSQVSFAFEQKGIEVLMYNRGSRQAIKIATKLFPYSSNERLEKLFEVDDNL